MSEWISIEDGLPEEFKGVLCFNENAAEYSKYFTGSYSHGRWILDELAYHREVEVTHWMPLPEPPK